METPQKNSLREKQGRDMHPKREGVDIPFMRRSSVKRWLNDLYRAVLLGL